MAKPFERVLIVMFEDQYRRTSVGLAEVREL